MLEARGRERRKRVNKDRGNGTLAQKGLEVPNWDAAQHLNSQAGGFCLVRLCCHLSACPAQIDLI